MKNDFADTQPTAANQVDTDKLVAAAAARAEMYAMDDRPGIKTDIVNSFYAGAYYRERIESGGSKVERRNALRLIHDIATSSDYGPLAKIERIAIVARSALDRIE